MEKPLVLTQKEIDSIIYLHTHEEGEKVKGRIRVKGKCPKCKGKFTPFGNAGFLCGKCQTQPKRYYIDLPLNGDRHRICSDDRGFPLDSFKRASALRDDINYDLRNGSFDPAKYKKEDRAKFYLDVRWNAFKKRQDNPSYLCIAVTFENYMFDYFRKTQDVRAIEQKNLNMLAEKLMQAGLMISTIKSYFKPFLSMLHYDKKQDIPIKDLEMPSFPKKLSRKQAKNSYIPEIAEALEILQRIPVEVRDIFLFILTHGCRPNEARAMKAKDFNFTNNTVRFVRGFSKNELLEWTKTHDTENNAEARPIHKDMLERLRQLCMAKNPEDFLFTRKKGMPFTDRQFEYIFKKAAKAAGLPNIEPYKALKHAPLSSMASESGDIYNTSKLAGHSTTAMTEKHYTKKLNLKKISDVQMQVRIPTDLIPKN